ncbi:MAG TPA: glucose-6-phosphate dehydrogenase [Burkholderiales bacterium]|nr:glucose-6-phosphate dehydrogenase [Burkholderiales bacterium]
MRKSSTDPCLFVIFGATGDLMRRKLLPALHQLTSDALLPGRCHILGVGRDQRLTDERFRRQALAALTKAGQKTRRWCNACIDYHGIGDGGAQDYERLAARIAGIERRRGLRGDRVLYLALPPAAFPGTIQALGEAGLNRSKGWTRLVIEKPFGHDLASARRLNALVHRYFDEPQVYRIDHYLGKETVQNLLAFRFGNAMFESAWNRDHIESVQISVAEELGVEQRAGYYEQTGALRDMVQNHLTQLLTLTAMEVPAVFEADGIRFEKVKVLRAAAPIRADAVVFGQYGPGRKKGGKLRGYRQEPGVAKRSRTETFVGLRLEIDNWRWQGVPFYLRTGKRLDRQATEITITFRRPPIALFRALDGCTAQTNVLVMTLQPEEGFDLSFEVKAPGERFTLQTRHMTFRYAEAFGRSRSTGYETLLLEVVRGDQTLFVHADEAEASWRLYTPLLRKRRRLHSYPAGGPGPAGVL